MEWIWFTVLGECQLKNVVSQDSRPLLELRVSVNPVIDLIDIRFVRASVNISVLFTTSGERIAQMASYPIEFIAQSSNTASDYDNDDYVYRMLAPTTLTLLQQQPRGISSGSSIVEKGCHWSGRPTLIYPSNVTEEAWTRKCSSAITSSLSRQITSHVLPVMRTRLFTNDV